MRIAVIGTGIVGVCSAAWLQRDGHEVIFVDPREAGTACSFGNAGQLTPSHIIPIGFPGIWKNAPKWLLDPLGPLAIWWPYAPQAMLWLTKMLPYTTPAKVESLADALNSILRTTFESYDLLIPQARNKGLVRQDGPIYVYKSRKALERDQWAVEMRRSRGARFIEITAPEIEDLEPNFAGSFQYGYSTPDNGSSADPEGLVKLIYNKCLSEGARHIFRTAVGFEKQGKRVVGVKMDSGEPLAVDGLVLATGAWSKNLAADLGDKIPLETQRGYHVTIHSTNIKLARSVIVPENAVIFAPMKMGLRLAGSVEFAGLKRRPHYERADELLRQAVKIFPDLDTSDVSKWMGHRPCLPDSLPVLGRAKAVDNAWYAFGHGHMGMSSAATTGRALGDLIAGRATQFDLKPFSADRF